VRKVGEVLHGQVLRGAIAEIGFWCSATVYAAPAYAVPKLLKPLMNSVLPAHAGTSWTGCSGSGAWGFEAEVKASQYSQCGDFEYVYYFNKNFPIPFL